MESGRRIGIGLKLLDLKQRQGLVNLTVFKDAAVISKFEGLNRQGKIPYVGTVVSKAISLIWPDSDSVYDIWQLIVGEAPHGTVKLSGKPKSTVERERERERRGAEFNLQRYQLCIPSVFSWICCVCLGQNYRLGW